MGEQRGPWYLLTGLAIGLALGLVYAWWINPVAYVNTAPASLRPDSKEAYRSLIAAAFGANGNLERARVRLSLLKDPDPAAALAAQAQFILAQGGSQEDARRLALLAAALAKPPASFTREPSPTTTATTTFSTPTLTTTSTPILTTTSTPTLTTTSIPTLTITVTAAPSVSPTPSRTLVLPTATPSLTRTTTLTLATPLPPEPTRTPTPTLGAPFVLQERTLVCDPTLPEALLQVQVTDAAGTPIPGVEIRITWQDGQDSFFTGLKPELGIGYADFVMAQGTVYTVRLAEGSQAVSNLSVPACGRPGETNFWGGWLLVFTQ